MKERSTKPYLVRAIYEWCTDSGLTPYIQVQVDAETRVPVEYVKNGEIVLNVSAEATHRLTLGNDLIQFAARFNGVSRELSVPIEAVKAIFARENGQGYFFKDTAEAGADAQNLHVVPPVPPEGPTSPPAGGVSKKPHLQIIK